MMSWAKSSPKAPVAAFFYVGVGSLLALTAAGRGRFHVERFSADEAGRGQFATLLQRMDEEPVMVLVDTVEEEYLSTTLPHVRGEDRRAVIDRKLAQTFHATPLRYAQIQGRELSGRRDDRVLCTALTNPQLVQPWLDLIEQHHIPVAGVCSMPFIGSPLVRLLKIKTEYALLVCEHGESGLRQSLYHAGNLVVSRLTPIPLLEPAAHAQEALLEIERTQRYLAQRRLVPRDKKLSIWFLSEPSNTQAFRDALSDRDPSLWHVVPLSELLAQAKLNTQVAVGCPAALLLQVAHIDRPANHYATRDHLRLWRLYQLRQRLRMGTVVIGLVGLVMSGVHIIDGLLMNQHTASIATLATQYESSRQRLVEQMPQRDATGAAMQARVEGVQKLVMLQVSPQTLLTQMSQALTGLPHLTVEKIEWHADPGRLGAPAVSSDGTAPPPAATAEEQNPGFDTLIVEGLYQPLRRDYRAALNEVEQLAAIMRLQAGVTQVVVIRPPLDLRPEATVQGRANREESPNDAHYTLKIMVRTPYAAA